MKIFPGSSLLGYTICPPSKLRHIFRNHNSYDEKTAISWRVGEGDTEIEIYEYKSTSNYDEDLPDPEIFLQATQDYAWIAK